jgi:hypothetical protein
MHRTLVLSAMAAIALPAGFAGAGDQAEPPAVQIEAYVDEAPAGAQVVEQVRVTRDGNDRVLYVVTARPASSDHPGRLFRDEENGDLAVQLTGAQEEVQEIMKSAKGSKVTGTFAYHRGSRRLIVQDVGS